MLFDFLILGGNGLQGRIVTNFLLKKGYRVSSADLYDENLKKIKYAKSRFTYHILDIENNKELRRLIKKTQPNVIINCVEGHLNLEVQLICLEQKKNIIDLGSDWNLTAKQLKLHNQFKEKNLISITGCGSTPGINNIMCKYASNYFDQIETIELGFAWNSNIKEFVVPFSMPSILYELTDEATYFEQGIKKEILPKNTQIQRKFKSVGLQSLFLVPHPEVNTFMNHYKRKGVKNIYFYAGFPKHSLEVLNSLTQLGFNNNENPLNYFGGEVYPTEFLSRLLKRLEVPNSYTEIEELWVKVTGLKNKRKKKIHMSCIVHSLKDWIKAGSNIDTGIPAAIIGEMILKNEIKKYGSFTPEDVINPEDFFKKLKKYNMKIFCNKKRIN